MFKAEKFDITSGRVDKTSQAIDDPSRDSDLVWHREGLSGRHRAGDMYANTEAVVPEDIGVLEQVRDLRQLYGVKFTLFRELKVGVRGPDVLGLAILGTRVGVSGLDADKDGSGIFNLDCVVLDRGRRDVE